MGRAFGKRSDRLTEQTFDVGHPAGRAEQASGRLRRRATDRFLVFGSGNLGLIYVAGRVRAGSTLDDLTARFPALVPGLVAHPGVAFAVVDTADHGPVVIGAAGEHRVREGVVVGDDPLARSGRRRRRSCSGPRPCPRRPTSTSTACSTTSARSRRSRASSAATEGSAAGRTGR